MLGRGEIETEGHLAEAGLLQADDDLLRQAVGGGRNGGHPETEIRPEADQLAEILSLRGISPAQHDDRCPQLRGLCEDLLPLIGIQLVRIPEGLGAGAAVAADQVTGLRRLPDDQEWCPIVVH
jgi:hypothetical protein